MMCVCVCMVVVVLFWECVGCCMEVWSFLVVLSGEVWCGWRVCCFFCLIFILVFF